MEFDDILKNYLGDFGRYQIGRLLALSVNMIILNLYFCEYSYIAWNPVIECAEKGQYSFNLSTAQPVTGGEGDSDQCHVSSLNYGANASKDFQYYDRNDSDVKQDLDEISQRKCKQWNYDSSPFRDSIVSEWDLVCDKEYISALSQAIFMSGTFAQLFFGSLPDKYGRRPVICVFLVISIVLHLVTAFSVNVYMFLVLRFLCGCAISVFFLASYTLGIEQVSSRWRAFMGVLFMYMWAIGYGVLAAVVYIARGWRGILIASTLVTLPLLFYFCLLDESPRWLIANNRQRRAREVMLKIARINGKTLPQDLCISYKPERKAKLAELAHSKKLLLQAFIMCFNWSATAVIYYTLVFYLPNVGGNIYISLLIGAGTEILASAYAHLTLNTILGRKLNTLLAFLLSAVLLLCLPFVPSNATWIRIALVTLGKLGVTANWTFVYVHACEIYPTKLRSSFLSLGFAVSRVGVIMSPFISQLQAKEPYWVTLCMAGIGFVAAFLCVFLPETRGRNMADTLEQLEHNNNQETNVLNEQMSVL